MSILKIYPSLLILIAFLLSAGCGGGQSKYSNSKTTSNNGPGHSQVYTSGHGSGHASDGEAPSSSEASDYSDDSDSSYRASVRPDSVAQEPRERPGLGTRFGEHRNSTVTRRRFERGSRSPFAKVALHYNNLAGIQAQSWYRGTNLQELRAQTRNGGISISLVDGNGRLLRGGTGAGRTYVVGRDGERYALQIRNDTGGTYEMVASVDGLDVVDGKPANFSKRGYILAPYSTLVVDGFRTSQEAVAAFRFGSVAQSYASRTSGDRNVGVIGFAFFAERGSRWTTDEIRRRETANPFPGEFARPPSVVR